MIKKIINFLKIRKYRWMAFSIIMIFGLSGALVVKTYFKQYLSPGPLSTFHNGNPLGGVNSHAEIGTKCIHCHAPVHCVTDTRCQDCHMDIAKDRENADTLHGMLPGVSKCQTCHPEHNGADANLTVAAFPNVNHYLLAGFSLTDHQTNYDGSAITCKSCHDNEGEFLATVDCVTCHVEEDHDYVAQHIEDYGIACFECHDGQDRMVKDFDHASWYPLEGGHKDQKCILCHTDQHYVGQSEACKDCHVDPEVHLGEFGPDCSRCHTETAWKPAELIRHDFDLNRGGKVVEDCETCHVDSYTTYTCIACHSDEEMLSIHATEEIYKFEDCMQCHLPVKDGETTNPPIISWNIGP
jgi:hypothetical protein